MLYSHSRLSCSHCLVGCCIIMGTDWPVYSHELYFILHGSCDKKKKDLPCCSGDPNSNFQLVSWIPRHCQDMFIICHILAHCSWLWVLNLVHAMGHIGVVALIQAIGCLECKESCWSSALGLQGGSKKVWDIFTGNRYACSSVGNPVAHVLIWLIVWRKVDVEKWVVLSGDVWES